MCDHSHLHKMAGRDGMMCDRCGKTWVWNPARGYYYSDSFTGAGVPESFLGMFIKKS